jgi:hypothetical protein
MEELVDALQRGIHDHRACGFGGDLALMAKREADGGGHERWRSLLGIFTRAPRAELAEDLERFRAIAATSGIGLRVDERGSRNGPRF